MTFKSHLILLSILATLFSCEKVTDDLNDAISEDPQRSTCEAYCDWAVGCHAAARDLDQAALLEQCLTQTRARDSECQEAETTGLNLASAQLMKSCVEDIDARKNDCTPFTGNAVEINTAIPPVACADVDLFNTARTATDETNDELCGRMSETLCTRSVSCLESYFMVPQDVLDLIDPSAQTRCITRFEDDVTSSCREEQLYSIDEESNPTGSENNETALPDVLYSVNENREAARACLTKLAMLPCEDLFSGMLPAECAGAFSDPLEATGALTGFACELELDALNSICGG